MTDLQPSLLPVSTSPPHMCSHAWELHVDGVCSYPDCTCGLPVRPYIDTQVPSAHGSDTSRAAAQSQEPTLGTKQATVLALIRQADNGITDDDLETETGWRHQTVSARRRELVLAGLIVDSGDRRLTSSGRRATVWRARV